MTQNRSSAVMAQRREPHDSLDFFPTPPWATRAAIEKVLIGNGWRRDQLEGMTAEDPCCGAMHMVRPLKEYFGAVHASDIHDYGMQARVADFLLPHKRPSRDPDFIFFNPPFRLALEFILKAAACARQAVCVLVRTSFGESLERYRELFSVHEPLFEAIFVERVVMVKGRCIDPDAKHWDAALGAYRRISSATSYSWFVFPGRDFTRTSRRCEKLWIPPCRKELQRPGDYDPPLRKPAEMSGGELL